MNMVHKPQPQPQGHGQSIPAQCKECAMLATKVPVVEVPIVGYPLPVRLQAKFGLCDRHAAAFNLNKYTDFAGAWYEMVCDQLRMIKKPAVNPYPEDPSFRWEEWIIDPDWHAAPKAECRLMMWDIRILQGSKGMKQKLW